MSNPSHKSIIAVWLLSTIIFGLQSCDEQHVQLDKSKVQFSLSPGGTSEGRARTMELPDDASLRISVESASGTPVFSNHEIHVSKTGDGYFSEPLELLPGNYVITDFMTVTDGEVLNAAPKSKSDFSSLVMNSLPYNFSVAENGVAKVGMQVIDARNEKPEAFGYTSFKMSALNKLSFMVSAPTGGQASLKGASAELRRGNHLIKTFPVKPGMNNIGFEGDPDAVYTLSVLAGETADVKTFNYKALKKELGAKPLKMALKPALLLTMESSVDQANEYEDFFELVLDGTEGAININWGDGYENSYELPLAGVHEYTVGTYTAVITGDLDQITNLWGFSYGTVIYGIKGLTNLTALKTYNPSWGAVPVKVDLSQCESLETIYIEKHGGPYEPIDLRTDFKLPENHLIKNFVFYASSIDGNREYISSAEFDVFVDNIYNNTTRRSIYDGKFFVYPVETPSPEAQRKLDILQNQYNWDVRLDGNIWDYSEAGRTKQDLNTRRENWLREKFPNSKHLLRSAKMAFRD